jgi:thioredoxin reductase
MIHMIGVPGAGELVGKGVYLELPMEIPRPLRDRNAIVTGDAADCATAAKQLEKAGWRVHIVMRKRYVRGVGRECRRKVATEVVCAAGGEYLEAVLLRRISTGRLEALNASALFIL